MHPYACPQPFISALESGNTTRIVQRIRPFRPKETSRQPDIGRGSLIPATEEGCATLSFSCADHTTLRIQSPYVVGAHLWVKETWNVRGIFWTLPVAMSKAASPDAFVYAASPPNRWAGGWRLASQMPRWASRFSLEVLNSTACRVQDVSEEEACAVGLPLNWHGPLPPHMKPSTVGWLTPAGYFGPETTDDTPECRVWWKGKNQVGVVYSAREAFVLWWNHQSKPGSRWKDNPWVWVHSVKKV
jgi:hypothetical protein